MFSKKRNRNGAYTHESDDVSVKLGEALVLPLTDPIEMVSLYQITH